MEPARSRKRASMASLGRSNSSTTRSVRSQPAACSLDLIDCCDAAPTKPLLLLHYHPLVKIVAGRSEFSSKRPRGNRKPLYHEDHRQASSVVSRQVCLFSGMMANGSRQANTRSVDATSKLLIGRHEAIRTCSWIWFSYIYQVSYQYNGSFTCNDYDVPRRLDQRYTGTKYQVNHKK